MPPRSSDITLISTWVIALKQTVDASGFDGNAVLESVGIDPNTVRDTEARILSTQADLAFNLAAEVTDNPAIGLEIARNAHPSSWHALGYSLLASSTLRAFFDRLSRNMRMLSQVTEISFEEVDGGLLVSADIKYEGVSPARIDAFVAIIVKLCRQIYRRDFTPARLALPRVKPGDTSDYEEFFQCPIEFESEGLELLILERDIDVPLAAANSELARRNDEIVIEYLARYDVNRLIPRVQAEIIAALPGGKTNKELIARDLNMSTRTLQRRLREEGTTFNELLNETRKDLSIRYMREGHRSIKEITYLLGFTDPSNFARAFKRWTGKSPSEVREGG